MRKTTTPPVPVELPEGVRLTLGRKVDDGAVLAFLRSDAGFLKFDWSAAEKVGCILDLDIKPAWQEKGHATRLLDGLFRMCSGGVVHPGCVVAVPKAAYGLIRVLARLRDQHNVRLGTVPLDPEATSARIEDVDMSVYFDSAAYEERQSAAARQSL